MQQLDYVLLFSKYISAKCEIPDSTFLQQNFIMEYDVPRHNGQKYLDVNEITR